MKCSQNGQTFHRVLAIKSALSNLCYGLLFNILFIGPVKQKKCMKLCFFPYLSDSLNICFEYSKEPSHCDFSFENPQHKFLLRNKKINFQ